MGDHRANFTALKPAEADRNWPIVVRRARATDRDAVLAFATRTWDGWDYIPHAWPVWLEASDGVLLVATVGRAARGERPLDADGHALTEDQPIAISRVALLSPAEGWVEGIRVDPRVRGMGVATDLQVAELHWLAAHETAVTRYATGARNEGSRRLGARHGFQTVTRFRTWFWRDPAVATNDHDETNGFDETARLDANRRRRELLLKVDTAGLILRRTDVDRWWRRVDDDPGFADESRLYELRPWAVQELGAEAFAGHVAAGEVAALDEDSGWAVAIISAEAMPAEDVAIHLALTVGTDDVINDLVRRIQTHAGESIRFRLPAGSSNDATDSTLTASGFEARPWELYILGRPDDPPLPAIDDMRLVLGEAPRRVIRPPVLRPPDRVT